MLKINNHLYTHLFKITVLIEIINAILLSIPKIYFQHFIYLFFICFLLLRDTAF